MCPQIDMSFPSIDKFLFFSFCIIQSFARFLNQGHTILNIHSPIVKASTIYCFWILGLFKKFKNGCWKDLLHVYVQKELKQSLVRPSLVFKLLLWSITCHISSLIHQSSFTKYTDSNDIYERPEHSLGIFNFEFWINSGLS